MHVSHRPFLPVWTPQAPAPKATPDSAEFVEIARIAEDLGEGGKRGRFNRTRRGRGRAPQPASESAAADSGAKNLFEIGKWSPASIATFDLTTIGAAKVAPAAASPEDAKRPQKLDAPEDEPSIDDLLARIVSAD